jgi:hypothetical protein
MHHISWQKADLGDDKECSPAVDINAASNWRSFGTSRCSSQKNLHRFALRPKGGWRPFMAQTASSPQRGVMPAIEAKAEGRRTWPPPFKRAFLLQAEMVDHRPAATAPQHSDRTAW